MGENNEVKKQNENISGESAQQNNMNTQKNITAQNNKNEQNNKTKKSKTGVIIAVIIVIATIFIVSVVGIAIAAMTILENFTNSKRDKDDDNRTAVNIVQNNVTNVAENNTTNNTTNTTKENKATKKDDSKPYVYKATYGEDKQVKKKDATSYGSSVFDSSKDLVAPYINIDSEAANSVNYQIKKLYNGLYDGFIANDDGTSFEITGMNYSAFQNKNILSIIISHYYAVVPGGGDSYIETYNFNLETGEEATKEEIAKVAGFSADACNEKIRKFTSQMYENASETGFEGVKNNSYYLNKKGELIIIYSGCTAGSYETGYNLNTGKDENISNDNNEANNNIENSSNTKTTEGTSKNEVSSNTTSKEDKGAEEIKKCFKDKQWVKNNVMMKESVFGEPIKGNRKVTFIKVDNSNFSQMYVVQDFADQDLSVQLFIVSYQNDKVVVEPMQIQHSGHGGSSVDANNAVVGTGYIHMGYQDSTEYSIKTGKPEFLSSIGIEPIDVYGEENKYYKKTNSTEKMEITEAEYNKIVEENNKKYNFAAIETKLTDANVDKYVK